MYITVSGTILLVFWQDGENSTLSFIIFIRQTMQEVETELLQAFNL